MSHDYDLSEVPQYANFTAEFKSVSEDLLADLGQADNGFNEYGVRQTEDGVDVIFRAMEPGTRNGIDIPADTLESIASHRYHKPPFQMDHSKSQRDNVGYIDTSRGSAGVWFRDNTLGMQLHIPDTGSTTRSDVIADFTHEPPAIQDGSVGFDKSTQEFDLPDGYDSIGEWGFDYVFGMAEESPTMLDSQILEFSLTPFPAGYNRQTGGLAAAFSGIDDPDEINRLLRQFEQRKTTAEPPKAERTRLGITTTRYY